MSFLVLILTGALAIFNWYVEYELPTWVHGLQCDGSESTLLKCSITTGGSCPVSSDASVICPGKYSILLVFVVKNVILCDSSSRFYLLQLYKWQCEIGGWFNSS